VISIFTLGYLTKHQREIWKKRQQGQTQSQIGKTLGISRQAIHRIFTQIDEKLNRALTEASTLNRITPTHSVNPVQGLIFGYSETLRMDSLLIYHPTYGIQLWYEYEGDCSRCQQHTNCHAALLDLYTMHNIDLPSDSKNLETNRLAQNLLIELKQKSTQHSGAPLF
jgi:DNA-binding XRE family transcriptional regulator